MFVCAWVPPDFAAVGQAYLDFSTDHGRRGPPSLGVIASVSPVGIEPTLDPF